MFTIALNLSQFVLAVFPAMHKKNCHCQQSLYFNFFYSHFVFFSFHCQLCRCPNQKGPVGRKLMKNIQTLGHYVGIIISTNKWFISPSGIISVNSRRTPFTASGENEILDLEGDLYLGGLPDNRAGMVLPTELWTAMLNCGYVGCVRDLFIDGRSKDIRQIAQSQNMTGIKSSCNKLTGKQCDSNPCKNNGVCKEGWNRFICDCTGTGYWDFSCDKGEDTSTPTSLFVPLCPLLVIMLLVLSRGLLISW